MLDRWKIGVAAVAVLVAACWAVWIGSPAFPLDDAYISQHSAEALLRNEEWRFVGSAPLQGVTSIAHVAVLALFGLIMPIPIAQMLLACLAFVAYVVGVFGLGRGSGLSNVSATLLTILGVTSGYAIYHLSNGLETGIAMAAVVWAVVGFRDPLPKSRWPFALLGAMPFIRPELALLAALLGLRAAWSSRHDFRQLVGPILFGLAGAAPFALICWWQSGSLVPNTVDAKKYFFAEDGMPAGWKANILLGAVLSYLISLGLVSVGFIGVVWSHLRWVSLLFIAGVLAAFFISLPGGPWHNYHRYLLPLLPLALTGWAALSSQRQWARKGMVVAAVVSVMFIPIHLRPYVRGLELVRNDLAGAVSWIVANTPDGDPVLVHDAGLVSQIGSVPLVDLVGLKSPKSVEVHKTLTWPSPGRRNAAAIDVIARASGARHFVVLDDWDQTFELTASLRRTGWTVERADEARGASRYKVYRIAAPAIEQSSTAESTPIFEAPLSVH